jgi:hypothetical protein
MAALQANRGAGGKCSALKKVMDAIEFAYRGADGAADRAPWSLKSMRDHGIVKL